MQRRHLLTRSSAALAGWTLLSTAPFLAPSRARAADAELARRKLIVVMLRGAVDGLSVVAPHGERAYHQARERIALAAPGSSEGCLLPLNSLFGLHPALTRLQPLWAKGQLGFVHASGSPDPTRSHFDAQDHMESGTPGRKTTPDGWMNRLLSTLPGPASPTRAVNMGATPPRILSGSASVANLGLGPRAFEAKAIDNPKLQSALSKLYADQGRMGRTYEDTTTGRAQIQRSMHAASDREARAASGPEGGMGGMSMGRGDPTADAGAPSARSFAADARRLGQLIQADPHTQLAFTAVGGWDTHVNQGGATGQLATRLGSLAEGLEALVQGLGDALRDTVIVVMSEFGRTVRQNGTGGTDHGRGNVMWLLGGPVAGGQVLGDWPGLDTPALVDGRDLAVTTDFRAVLSPILQQHLGISDAALAQVFPGNEGRSMRGRVLRG